MPITLEEAERLVRGGVVSPHPTHPGTYTVMLSNGDSIDTEARGELEAQEIASRVLVNMES